MQKGSDVLKKDVLNKRLAASLLAGVLTVTSIGGASLLTSASYADDSYKETTQVSSSKEASTSKSTTKSSKSSKSNKSTSKNANQDTKALEQALQKLGHMI